MSIWKKIKTYVMDLYYWRVERKLVMEQNETLRRQMHDELLAEKKKHADAQKRMGTMVKDLQEVNDRLETENAQVLKALDELSDELVHQRDINECLWADWGAKHAEWAVATKKLQDKDDEQYRLWAEHTLLLAAMLMAEPEEARKFHV